MVLEKQICDFLNSLNENQAYSCIEDGFFVPLLSEHDDRAHGSVYLWVRFNAHVEKAQFRGFVAIID